MTLNDLKEKYHLTPQEIRQAIDAGFTMDNMLDLYSGEIIERQNAALEAEPAEEFEKPVQPIGVPKPKRGRPSNAAKAAQAMATTAVNNVIPQRQAMPFTTPKERAKPVSATLNNGMRATIPASVYKSQVAKVHNAIRELRKYNTPGKTGSVSKGIHAVYMHFNEEMPEKLGVGPGEPLQHLIALMAQRGDIGFQMVRGGPMLYLPGEAPVKKGLSAEDAKNILANL